MYLYIPLQYGGNGYLNCNVEMIEKAIFEAKRKSKCSKQKKIYRESTTKQSTCKSSNAGRS